ncbi:MAG: hypothetical protein AMXMBFR81_15450 [Chthonomonas sp.]|nr:hypothetical protein [Fimbriimonadaceae bacterium]
MEAVTVAGMLVALAYATLLLGGYIFGMFMLWKAVGSRSFCKFNRLVVVRAIWAGAAFLGSLAVLLPIEPTLRLTTALIVFILHGTPAYTGFSVGVATFEDADRLRREQRTVQWLLEWEDERAARTAHDDDA